MELSDDDIIRLIRSEGEDMEKACLLLYEREWKKTQSILLEKGLPLEDAKDIFQDAMLSFLNAVLKNKYDGTSSISCYFQGLVKVLSEHNYIRMIRSGGEDMEKACEMLYKREWKKIRSMLLGKGMSLDDAKEIFQRAFMIFYLAVIAGKYRGTGSISSYIYGVVLNLLLQYFKEESRKSSLENVKEEGHEEETIEKEIEKEETIHSIRRLLMRLTKREQDLIRMRFFLCWGYKKIAEKLGLKNEQVARNLAYRILKKLRDILGNDPEFTDLLT